MSAHRIKGEVSFSCDECPETLETEKTNFDAALRVLERAGWKLLRRNRQWENMCPACWQSDERVKGSSLSSSRMKSLGFPVKRPQ